MTPHRREIRNRYSRPAIAGDAEITLKRAQHLDLARERDALHQSMRMDGEAVARLAQPSALTDKTSRDFALTDLRARPARSLRLAGAQDQLGGGASRPRCPPVLAL